MPSPRQALALWLSRRRALPYRTRRSAIKRLHPAMLEDFPFEAEFFGLRFKGNIVNYIDRLVYFCGGHEKYLLHFLRDAVAAIRALRAVPLTFLDVGANAGNHALVMAKCVEQVLAFEPFERVRGQLEENIALNGLTNITVFPFGLGNENARIPFYAGPESNLGAASFCDGHYEGSRYLADLEIRRGDEVMAQEKINRVDVIKADVEGFERQVLEGLARTMRRDRPLVIFELSPKTRESIPGQAALTALFPPNYTFWSFRTGRRDSGRYRLAPFDYAAPLPKLQEVIACPGEFSLSPWEGRLRQGFRGAGRRALPRL